MNNVDLHVKHKMLQSPSIFPNRVSVLAHIFLFFGTGYEWTRAGTLASIYDDPNAPMPSSIDMSDLDEQAQMLTQDAARNAERYPGESVDTSRQVDLGLARLTRAYVGEHIDVYASKNLAPKDSWLNHLSHIESFQHTPLATIPKKVAKLDKDWVTAADEVAFGLREALRQRYDVVKTTGALKGAPKHLTAVYERLSEVLEQLEPVTQRKANAKRAQAILSRLMGSL